jgi:hypothetical protein
MFALAKAVCWRAHGDFFRMGRFLAKDRPVHIRLRENTMPSAAVYGLCLTITIILIVVCILAFEKLWSKKRTRTSKKIHWVKSLTRSKTGVRHTAISAQLAGSGRRGIRRYSQ